MQFVGIDHIVLTVKSIEKTIEFYCRGLGMEEITFGQGRKAIRCGNQKINLHQVGKEFEPKAHKPTPGSTDICFIVATPVSQVVTILEKMRIQIVEGPVERTGTHGKILSVYVRDPDQNLIEISNQI